MVRSSSTICTVAVNLTHLQPALAAMGFARELTGSAPVRRRVPPLCGAVQHTHGAVALRGLPAAAQAVARARQVGGQPARGLPCISPHACPTCAAPRFCTPPRLHHLGCCVALLSLLGMPVLANSNPFAGATLTPPHVPSTWSAWRPGCGTGGPPSCGWKWHCCIPMQRRCCHRCLLMLSGNALPVCLGCAGRVAPAALVERSTHCIDRLLVHACHPPYPILRLP